MKRATLLALYRIFTLATDALGRLRPAFVPLLRWEAIRRTSVGMSMSKAHRPLIQEDKAEQGRLVGLVQDPAQKPAPSPLRQGPFP
jgi:hypothetical protein